MTGHWTFGKKRNILERSIIFISKPIFKYLFPEKYNRFREYYSYSDDPDRFIIIRLVSKIFNIFWAIYKLVIPTSSINKHELYFSSIIFKKV